MKYKEENNSFPSVESIQKIVSDNSINVSEELKKIKLTSALDSNNICNKIYKYMILTYINYPCGGGESFLYQTINWAKNIGMECVWLSLSCIENGESDEDIIKNENDCIFHQISKDNQLERIKELIKYYNPDIIHITGNIINICFDFLIETRIPLIIGYHFWTGLVRLNEKTFNKDIIKNKKLHILSSFYIKNLYNFLINQYVASEFMNDVLESLGGPTIKDVIYPIPVDENFLVNYNVHNEFIAIINLNKGSELILEIVKNIRDIKFVVVDNEKNNNLKDIKKQIRDNINGKFYHRYTDVKNIYSITKIMLIPSDVDETFCRVAYEAAKCGIPIITTGKGYIRKMLGDAAVYLTETPEDWIETIRTLYNDREKLVNISNKLIARSKHFDSQEYKFRRLLIKSLKNTPSRNIMIFCPWGDQGLGIQSRIYCDCLIENGFNVHIFSYISYFVQNTNKEMQSNKAEWLNYTSIYYSYNNRENVSFDELKYFVLKNNIGICLIPEICYEPIFKKVEFMKGLGVKCYAIPNIEICRKSELEKYKIFDKVLCNTNICYDILSKYMNNISYIGHFCDNYNGKKYIIRDINFLHIAGYNSMTRKQTLKICDAFFIALNYCDNITLTITFSDNIPDEILKYKHDKLKIIYKKLSHANILDLYKKHHVSIQVASHEGLGLGFYESISYNTPVITLNCPPHNEIVKDNLTGWLINCNEFVLTDNDEALVNGYTFEPKVLAEKIVEIVMNIDILINTMVKIKTEKLKYNKQEFVKRLIGSIF